MSLKYQEQYNSAHNHLGAVFAGWIDLTLPSPICWHRIAINISVKAGWTRAPRILSQQTQNIRITFVQSLPNVFDVGPTLYKCYTNVLYLLGYQHFNSASVTLICAWYPFLHHSKSR